MKLKHFYGRITDWCDFVNEHGIRQTDISACNIYTNNGEQYVVCTYWVQG